MPWKLIYLDRRDNSQDKVGGLCTFLCDSTSEISNLPKGLPDEPYNYTPLPGSIAITLDTPSVYVLDLNNTWGQFAMQDVDSKIQTYVDDYLANHPVIPDAPTTDGVYTLKCTVSSGTPTYSWEV